MRKFSLLTMVLLVTLSYSVFTGCKVNESNVEAEEEQSPLPTAPDPVSTPDLAIFSVSGNYCRRSVRDTLLVSIENRGDAPYEGTIDIVVDTVGVGFAETQVRENLAISLPPDGLTGDLAFDIPEECYTPNCDIRIQILPDSPEGGGGNFGQSTCLDDLDE
jgi:hypothetical protein